MRPGKLTGDHLAPELRANPLGKLQGTLEVRPGTVEGEQVQKQCAKDGMGGDPPLDVIDAPGDGPRAVGELQGTRVFAEHAERAGVLGQGERLAGRPADLAGELEGPLAVA